MDKFQQQYNDSTIFGKIFFTWPWPLIKSINSNEGQMKSADIIEMTSSER